jgi:hypothetical protein
MEWDEIPEINLFSDGGAEPNPGKGGFGVVMEYKGKKKEFCQGYLKFSFVGYPFPSKLVVLDVNDFFVFNKLINTLKEIFIPHSNYCEQ